MVVILSGAWLVIVIWLLARAISQRGLLPRLPLATPPPREHAPRISVIIPARDEAENIGRCLHSLLAQNYPQDRFTVLVVDDHSADATAAMVRAIAAGRPQLSLLDCPPLPPGWTGKSHACWIGARAAADGEWLCFLDADVWGEPALLSCAVAAAQAQDLDLLSLAPRQNLGSFAERLILPCGLILLSFVQDLRQAQRRSGPDVTATGQFILIKRDVYEACGGHAAVARAICEDLELARRVKRSGRSVLLMSGDNVVSTRMYTGWQTLWPGLAKNLVDTFGGRWPTLTIAVASMALAWAALAIPAMDAIGYVDGARGALPALIMALLASAAVCGLHIAATFYFRIPFCYGLLFPLGYTVGALMAADSVRRRLSGQVSWKGRTYS